ncbi:snare associated Golgi protein-domain-containing protein [Xylariomycetidae sp. FL2044]|nr:snare associated Golgi protein-domain-containing protein [Xylariomycetidae sp. FL2044]
MNDVEMGKKKGDRPGEYENLEQPTEYKPIDWKKVLLTPKYIPWHILGIVIVVITVLITVYHDKVVEILRPFSEKVRDVPAGWLIPIVILVIISFPPLFGHEIIGLLCGVVYGLWIGFAIVAAGTFIGEVGTWFAFKKLLRRKAEKMERTNLNYASMAKVTRDSGFWMVFIIRFSIVPSHFSTAVFSTCDVKFWHFAVATFLTLPKQIFIVYLGVLLVAEDQDNKIETIVLVATFVITLVMGVYIWSKMKKAKVVLLREQEERRANYDMNRLKESEGASTSRLPTNAAGLDAGVHENSDDNSSLGSLSRPHTREDGPRDYSAGPWQPSASPYGAPAPPRPEMPRYDSTNTRMGSSANFSRPDVSYSNSNPYSYAQAQAQTQGVEPARPYYATENKPYYQRRPPRPDAPPYPQGNEPVQDREWV